MVTVCKRDTGVTAVASSLVIAPAVARDTRGVAGSSRWYCVAKSCRLCQACPTIFNRATMRCAELVICMQIVAANNRTSFHVLTHFRRVWCCSCALRIQEGQLQQHLHGWFALQLLLSEQGTQCLDFVLKWSTADLVKSTSPVPAAD